MKQSYIFASALLLSFFFTSGSINAQVTALDLNNFITPDYRRMTLESNLTGLITEAPLRQLGGFSRFRKSKFTREKQQSTFAHLGFTFNQHAFQHNINGNNTNREFKERYNLIYGLNFTNFYSNRNDDKFNYIKITPKIGIGIGRLETSRDLWLANTILETLMNEFNFGDYDVEAAQLLAEKIVQAKNARKLDSREERIKELEIVIAAIQTIYPNFNASPAHIIRTLDIYDYEGFHGRSVGKRLDLLLSPGYNYSYDDRIIQQNKHRGLTEIALSFDYDKALHMKWQWGNNIRTRHTTVFGSNDDLDYQYIDLSLSTVVHYLPNFRNAASLRMGIIERYSFNNEDLDSFIQLGGSYKHYFSPTLRLFLNCNYNFNFKDSNNNFAPGIWQFTIYNDFITVGLNHYMF